MLDTLVAHDDAVSALWLRDNLLVTASWDSTVKVWLCGGLQTSSSGKIDAELLAELDHDTGVSSCFVLFCYFLNFLFNLDRPFSVQHCSPMIPMQGGFINC